MEEKINELLASAEFSAKVDQAKSVAELAALFSAEGVEVTEEEIVKAMKATDTEELDESALEGVAGGVSVFAVGAAVTIAYLKKKYGDKWKTIFKTMAEVVGGPIKLR